MFSEGAVFETIYWFAFTEGIIWADEQNILFLELCLADSLGEDVQVAHALVIASALGKLASIGHLQLDIEHAANSRLARCVVGNLFLDHDVEADALVERILLPLHAKKRRFKLYINTCGGRSKKPAHPQENLGAHRRGKNMC